MGLFVPHISVQSVVRASEMPLQMRLLPRDRYAQLGSAAGIIISIGIMAAGVISGAWLEWMKARETVELFHYRYLPAWSAVCILIALGFFVLLYREWKRLGGDQHYTAP
jgi:predicted MFS family arabinose efflux permease